MHLFYSKWKINTNEWEGFVEWLFKLLVLLDAEKKEKYNVLYAERIMSH